MGKRAGLLRVAARAHGPSAGGSSSSKKTKIKKKLKVKPKASALATSAATTAAAACATATSAASDGLFALALPPVTGQVAVSIRRGKKKRAKDEMEKLDAPAFEDSSKNAMFQQILSAAKTSKPSGMIAADEHRARCEELKRVRAERQALKAERFAAHKKC